MAESTIVKQLTTRLHTLKTERLLLLEKSRSANQELAKKDVQIRGIQEKLTSALTDTVVTISEHAIIRYLERVDGLDIEAIKKEILTEKVEKLILELGGSGKFPSEDSTFKLVVKNHMIVTIED